MIEWEAFYQHADMVEYKHRIQNDPESYSPGEDDCIGADARENI